MPQPNNYRSPQQPAAAVLVAYPDSRATADETAVHWFVLLRLFPYAVCGPTRKARNGGRQMQQRAVSTELGRSRTRVSDDPCTGYSLHCTACSIGQLWKSSPLHRKQVSTFLYRIANCSLYDRSSCESIAYGRSTGIYPFVW